jgi:rare lipoprotein A
MVPGRYATFEAARAIDLAIEASGEVSVYPSSFSGRLMAGGRRYEPGDFVVSHAGLPLRTIVLITALRSGRSTFAEVADRTPPNRDYLMDVSEAVADRLFPAGRAQSDVVVRVVFRPPTGGIR